MYSAPKHQVSSPLLNRSEVIVLTIKQTDKQTDAAENIHLTRSAMLRRRAKNERFDNSNHGELEAVSLACSGPLRPERPSISPTKLLQPKND